MNTLKKIAAVAVLSLVLAMTVTTVAGAASFNTNLTIGSTGADVVALQTLLVSKGFLTMPVGVSMGYFGSLTKSAVAAWQASVGLPSTGYFGPLSRAAVGDMTSTVGSAGCPVGAMFNSMTGAPCSSMSSVPGCVAGAMFSSTTGQSCAGGTTTTTTGGAWVPDGTDGSITVSYVSYAPASQTLDKGDMKKPLISVKLQAVNGRTAVTRFDVHFSERPWLDFGTLYLTDSSGNVLATKTLTSAADVTEVTVGSDYLVRFDNFAPIVVAPGSDTIVAVAADVLAASDKINNQTVYVGIPAGSIRTINGKNYTDSQGLTSGQGSGVTAGTGNSVILSSSGSTGTIYSRIDPSSSPTTKIVVTSSSQSTPSVVLGVFGLKSQNQSATINSLSFNINNSTGVATSTLLSNLRLQAGGQTYGSNALTAGNTTFTNMSISLPQDQWIPVTLLADINSNQDGVSASSTLVKSSIVGVDSNYNTLDLSNASNQTSANNTYSLSGISVTSPSATVGQCTGATNSNPNNKCSVTFSFTITNVGNNDIFISKNPSIALATTSSASLGTVASTTLQSINIAAGTGDTTSSYDVSSNSSRTFTYLGTMSSQAGGGFESFKVSGIRFGTSATDDTADQGLDSTHTTTSTNGASIINFGLEPLFVSQTF